MKRFFKYCLWGQLYTPWLVWCIVFIPGGAVWQAMIASFVGAAVFYIVQIFVFVDAEPRRVKEKRLKRNLRAEEFIPYGLRRSIINRIKFWKWFE